MGREPSGSEADDPGPSPGEDLVEYMVELLNERTLNARQFCTVMYYAGRAGVREAAPYGLQPGAQSGHYQRKLSAVMPASRDRKAYYTVDVPGHSKHDLSRTIHQVPTLPPHECIVDDMGATGFETRLRECIGGGLPAAYWEHPAVRNAPQDGPGGPPVPVNLYVDGVPYSQTDSVLGWWVEVVPTGQRHLVAVFRKRNACRCGCRGWCNVWAYLRWLQWSFGALARGRWPNTRHDGKPWQPEDETRKARANKPFQHRAVVMFIKGDWSEYAASMGFPPWGDALRPCFECTAHGPDMYTAHGNSPLGLRWEINEETAYENACQRCEVYVRLSARARDKVASLLFYDKRPTGGRGRCLMSDIDELGLLASDRLEPSANLHDVSLLESAETPVDVVFWRSSRESLTRHRNPLFSDATGLNPMRNLTVDTLHAVHLGVLKAWCKVAVWFVLDSKLYGAGTLADERVQRSILALRHDLMKFYAARRGNPSLDPLTEVADLTVKMLGTRSTPSLKLKGAETFGFTAFLVDLLNKHHGHFGQEGSTLRRAGKDLLDMLDIWSRAGHDVPAEGQQAAFELYSDHMALMTPYNVFTPKHHLVFHLLGNVSRQGNPRRYAVWLDESLNKTLKQACRQTSQATFELSVLSRMRDLLRTKAAKRRLS